MWSRLRKPMRPLDAERVENIFKDGTPDVNHVHGWMELKYLKEWPKRVDTVVSFSRYTVDQRNWLRRRWQAGGGTSLMLALGGGRKAEWLLFPGDVAADLVGKVPRAELLNVARARWIQLPDRKELLQCLREFNSRI